MTIWYAGVVTLVGGITIFVITMWLISAAQPEQPAESVATRLYKIRGRYFLILMAGLVIILVLTLRHVPYKNSVSAAPEFTVPVSGSTWSWQIGPLQDRDGKALSAGTGVLSLPLGKPVEFQVTSKDVNHGFGIYNAAGHLVAQTQAMPGYVNSLVHTFAVPGKYEVLCMEYCGIAHHAMVSSFTVEASPGRGRASQ